MILLYSEKGLANWFHLLKSNEKRRIKTEWKGRVEEIITRVTNDFKDQLELTEEKVNLLNQRSILMDEKLTSLEKGFDIIKSKFETLERSDAEIKEILNLILNKDCKEGH